MAGTAEDIAEKVRTALGAADLAAYRDLLAPDVRWAAPGDVRHGCNNRDQVLAWYRAGRDRGVRAEVFEVVASTGHLLVGLLVSGRDDGDGRVGAQPRWQVLTVADGLVVDIRGYDDREQAALAAGVT